MPAYDYRCPACDTRFEVTRAFGDGSATPCPDCGVEAKRVFTPVGVVFKGSGFHNTDYRPRPAADTASGQTAEKKPADACSASGSASACATCPAAK